MPDNFLYYAENLGILRMPFRTNVRNPQNSPPRSDSTLLHFALLILNFLSDTWHWDQAAAKAYQETLEVECGHFSILWSKFILGRLA